MPCWLLLALILALPLLGAGTVRAEAGGDPVKARGVLRVGLEGTYPPFNFQDANGHLTGFEVDLANALAAQMGVQARSSSPAPVPPACSPRSISAAPTW